MAEAADSDSPAAVDAPERPVDQAAMGKLPFAVKKPGSAAGGEVVVATIEPGWNIQIGAYPSRANAEAKLADLSGVAALRGKKSYTIAVQKGSATFYRARFAGFDKATAAAACRAVKKQGQSCLVLAP